MSKKLPARWIPKEAVHLPYAVMAFRDTQFILSELYIPAARVREFIEDLRRKADVLSPVDVEKSMGAEMAAIRLGRLLAEFEGERKGEK